MILFLQFIINGLIIGGAYALIGIGLTLIFGIMNVVNFAHGEMYMLGAYFLFTRAWCSPLQPLCLSGSYVRNRS